ncbi:tripartite tricarboxylate transporter TctB family protein [Treponema sp. Marseille-Q4132]|uniref:tripartite tricarboxylate transporter TctB family protein n=1 Tax=Treponema sp. Marseille-Q4132 TaxID=2766701 RepID=UPI0016532988|nr:tripartite tricarboxylate transporter TctB family protein [Treponema sp. Marseille-Q4132]QNL96362.1 tripartite tricarboxylate transporter TctB family protein [Treponema sp. Marseille-Q4132]
MKKANIISAVIGIIVSAAAFGYTFTFKQFKNVPVGPEFFPRVLAIALFIFCVLLLLTNLKTSETNNKSAPTMSLKNRGMQKALAGLAIVVVYALLWEVLGFLIITPIAIFLMTLLLGKRSYIKMIIVAVGATAIVFLAFKYLLGIQMPLGFMEELF